MGVLVGVTYPGFSLLKVGNYADRGTDFHAWHQQWFAY